MHHFLYKLTVMTITNESYQKHVCLCSVFTFKRYLIQLTLKQSRTIQISHFLDFFERSLKDIFAKILGWLAV